MLSQNTSANNIKIRRLSGASSWIIYLLITFAVNINLMLSALINTLGLYSYNVCKLFISVIYIHFRSAQMSGMIVYCTVIFFAYLLYHSSLIWTLPVSCCLYFHHALHKGLITAHRKWMGEKLATKNVNINIINNTSWIARITELHINQNCIWHNF